LIEEWLEQMVVGAVDEGYVDVGALHTLRCRQPAESATDDDNSLRHDPRVRPSPPPMSRTGVSQCV
jgi:hypothetical protein